MRTKTLLLTLLTCMVMSTYAQFSGRCGDFRYTIDGKLISSVDVKSGNNKFHVNTYYKIDSKNGYVWFWVEESFPGRNKIGKFTILWSRLSDMDNESAMVDKNNPSSMIVALSSQKFFFTTAYTAQKKGPQYEVRSKLTIQFSNSQDAADFSQILLQNIPKY